jgi:U3 small nucleolar ribonucleoprotein component
MDYIKYAAITALASSILALVEVYHTQYTIKKQINKAVEGLFFSALKQLHEDVKPAGLSAQSALLPQEPSDEENQNKLPKTGVQIKRG